MDSEKKYIELMREHDDILGKLIDRALSRIPEAMVLVDASEEDRASKILRNSIVWSMEQTPDTEIERVRSIRREINEMTSSMSIEQFRSLLMAKSEYAMQGVLQIMKQRK